MTDKIEVIGKTVKLGNGSVLNIDGIKDDRFYTCSTVSKETGNIISDILVPINSCVNNDSTESDLKSIPQVNNETPVENGSAEVIDINDLFDMDMNENDIRVTVKKYPNEMEVVKITAKTLHFIDDTGKKRYVHYKTVKKVYNYGKKEPSSDGDGSSEKTESTEKTEKTSPEDNASKYAEAKGRDGSKSEKGKKNQSRATQVAQVGQKKSGNTKGQTKNRVSVKDYLEAELGSNIEYIEELPRFVNFKNEGRNVFIDIPEVKNGLKIRRVANGSVYWDDLETGKTSTKSLKKVNNDENIKVYEYK